MKLYIDVSVLTLATFVTGIQRVTQEFATRLIARNGEHVVLLHYNAKENCYHKIDNTKFCEYYLRGHGVKNKMITATKVPLEEMKAGDVFFDLDAAWMCRMKRSYLLPILKKQGVKIIAHIYDIISITHPQYCLERGVYNFMDYIGAHLQYADSMIVNAQATVAELEKLSVKVGIPLPPCQVVPLGANFGRNRAADTSQVPEEIVSAAEAAPYILMVGTIEPRKNHKLLLEAYEKGLKEQGYNIIMVGYMGWNMEDFQETLQAHPDYNTRIFHMEGVGDGALSYLYAHAKFVAFCSYTEGYGLPLIEAIHRGVPVLASDIPVSREVAGDYCIWFEQDNALELCEKVREYTADAGKYEALKKTFSGYKTVSWEESFEMLEAALKSAAEE